MVKDVRIKLAKHMAVPSRAPKRMLMTATTFEESEIPAKVRKPGIDPAQAGKYKKQ